MPTNLTANEQGALDVLFTAQSGQCLFDNLQNIPPLLEVGDNAYINTVSNPNFGGAYTSYGANGGPQFPTANMNDLDSKEIGHEFMHVFVDRNFPLLLTGGSIDGDNGGLIEGLCDIGALLIDVQARNLGSINDWSFEDRNLMDFPTTYDSPQYNINLGIHRKGLILGHWFYLISNGNCFISEQEAFEFLLECFATYNPCNYPTLREATLEHIQSNNMNGNACDECYNEMVNAWSLLGVGPPQQFESATVINQVVTNCSVFVEWENKGYPYHLCTLFEMGVTQPIDIQCVTFDQFYFSNLTQNSNNFTLIIEPMCDNICNEPLNVSPTPRSIIKPSQGITSNGSSTVITTNGAATGCDIVIEVAPSIGIDVNQIDFTINNTTRTPNTFHCVNGSWFFYFIVEPDENTFPINYTVDLNYCSFPLLTGTIQADPIFNYNFQIGHIQSKCAVQATVPPGVDFPVNTRFTPRIAMKEIIQSSTLI